jgi:hypothetical protein
MRSKNTLPKELTIKEIRRYVAANIEAASDVTVSRIYEVLTGEMAVNKTANGTIRIIT